jgi:hypothetical protein
MRKIKTMKTHKHETNGKLKDVWIIQATSESGDDYGPKKYDHNPTEEDKRNFILNETPEEIDCDGPGNFNSYVYLTVTKL